MVKEAWCSVETAELLQQKGADLSAWLCHAESKCNKDGTSEIVVVPTHQMALAWLRDKRIIIVPVPAYFNVDGYCSYWECDIWAGDNYEKCCKEYKSYEEAVEAALKYSLENLI